MTDRIHLVVDAAEKERFRRMAEREGKSLSAWLRDAAREKAASAEDARRLGTREELETFFEAADAREGCGREPDWEEHLSVIGRSRGAGATET